MGMFSQTRTRSPWIDRVSAEINSLSLLLLTMPVGDVLVGNTRGHIEHDNAALAVDVVAIS